MESAARADAMSHVVGLDDRSTAAPALPPEAGSRLSLRSIDIFRGIAAIWITTYHAWIFFWRTGLPPIGFHSAKESLTSVGTILFHEGWLGVNLFFVLSGFCIHLPYARRERLDLREYFVRRWLRIWPPYVVAVALGVVMVLMRHTPIVQAALNGFLHLFFWNWYLHPMSPKDQGLNPVFWTITIEVQLYAFYAIGWPLLRRIGILNAAWIFLAFGLAYHVGTELRWPDSEMLHSTAILSQRSLAINRFGEWLIGAAVAHALVNAPAGSAQQRSKRSLWALGLWGVAIIAISRVINDAFGWQRHVLEPIYSIGFAMLIAAAAFGEQRAVQSGETSPGVKERATGDNPLVRAAAAVGLRCYSLYLFHFPLLAATGEVSARVMHLSDNDKDTLGGKPVWLLTTLIALVVIAVWTEINYRLIELPSHHLARRVAKRWAKDR